VHFIGRLIVVITSIAENIVDKVASTLYNRLLCVIFRPGKEKHERERERYLESVIFPRFLHFWYRRSLSYGRKKKEFNTHSQQLLTELLHQSIKAKNGSHQRAEAQPRQIPKAQSPTHHIPYWTINHHHRHTSPKLFPKILHPQSLPFLPVLYSYDAFLPS